MSDAACAWVGVGRRGQNVGITNLSVRKSWPAPNDYQAFVSLVNYTPESRTFTFSWSSTARRWPRSR